MATGPSITERKFENADFHVRRLTINNVVFDLGAAEMSTGQNQLSTTPERILAGSSGRRFAELTNDDSSIKVYVGNDAEVSAITGHVLKPGSSLGFEFFAGEIWAVAASGTPTVTYVEW